MNAETILEKFGLTKSSFVESLTKKMNDEILAAFHISKMKGKKATIVVAEIVENEIFFNTVTHADATTYQIEGRKSARRIFENSLEEIQSDFFARQALKLAGVDPAHHFEAAQSAITSYLQARLEETPPESVPGICAAFSKSGRAKIFDCSVKPDGSIAELYSEIDLLSLI